MNRVWLVYDITPWLDDALLGIFATKEGAIKRVQSIIDDCSDEGATWRSESDAVEPDIIRFYSGATHTYHGQESLTYLLITPRDVGP